MAPSFCPNQPALQYIVLPLNTKVVQYTPLKPPLLNDLISASFLEPDPQATVDPHFTGPLLNNDGFTSVLLPPLWTYIPINTQGWRNSEGALL